MERLATSGRHAPVVLGLLGVLALLALYVLPEAVRPAATWPVFRPPAAGCQVGSRTVRHAGGVVLGEGVYEPCLIDTGMATGEPGLAISRDGTLLRSVTKGPTGIAVSSDNGATWTRRLLPAGTQFSIPDGYLDPVTDRYFYAGMGNTPVYASDDQGRTWQTGTFESAARQDWDKLFSGPPTSPRASGYPTNIYYCNWPIPGGIYTSTRCFKSVDGGRVFKTTGQDVRRPQDCGDPTQTKGSGHGRGVVDPRDGTIYLPVGFCGAIEVAVSRDEGATWTHNIVARVHGGDGASLLHAIASPAWRRQLMSGRGNPVTAEMTAGGFSDAIAMDASGRLYMVWIDESYRPVLSWSGDRGVTWSKPVAFAPPGVVQTVLPSLTVTPEGRVGLSYYGSTDRQTWTGYLVVSDNATAPVPTFETAPVTPPGRPLMPEACCWASGPQEYTAARWAPDGSLWSAFAATTSKGDARGVMGRLIRRQ